MHRLLSSLLFLLGLAVLGGALWWFTTTERRREAPQQRPPFALPVHLASVARGRLEPLVVLTGSVRSSEHSRLGFRVAGRIATLEAREGGRASRRAPCWLACEDDDQRAALLRAAAALSLAQRELALAEAGERAEVVARVEAELDLRAAELELARTDVERNRPLVGTDIITQSRFDALASAAKAAEARERAAEQELAEARAGTRPEDAGEHAGDALAL